MQIGRKASEVPAKQEAKPVRPAWPPSAFTPHSTLVQPCCVRCGNRSSELRNLQPESVQDRDQTEEYVASVCSPCWFAIEHYASQNNVTVEEAFWDSKPYRPTDEELGRLPEGLPWRADQARRMEAWRATRPEDQSLRPWPQRKVLVYLEPPNHQELEHACSRPSPRRPTPPTPSDSSFPPF